MKRSAILILSLFCFLAACKKKEEVIAISAKQKELLGKWRQTEVYEPNGTTNLLTPCELANNTTFEFRKDGRCYVSSPGNCVATRDNPYAISVEGNILAIDGVLYYVDVLNSTDLVFYSQINRQGFKQVWKRP
ncbi:MAG: hypothetical protein OHK0045_14190 [Raineya sp.]